MLERDKDMAHAGGILCASGLLVIDQLCRLNPGVTLLEDLLEALSADVFLLSVLTLLGLTLLLALLKELVCVFLCLGQSLLVLLALLLGLCKELLLVLLLPLARNKKINNNE